MLSAIKLSPIIAPYLWPNAFCQCLVLYGHGSPWAVVCREGTPCQLTVAAGCIESSVGQHDKPSAQAVLLQLLQVLSAARADGVQCRCTALRWEWAGCVGEGGG